MSIVVVGLRSSISCWVSGAFCFSELHNFALSMGDDSASERVNYTQEQIQLVTEITSNEDYYIILGIEKDSPVEEIRKAYRKLSLKIHPDKNNAPGAEEAFKALSNAFQCLNNDETRRKYDHGDDSNEFDSPNCERLNFRVLLQTLPMLLLLLVSYFPSYEPNYSLQKTGSYQFSKITKEHRVAFFVKLAEFDKEFPPETSARMGLEIQVERDYKNVLRRYCHIEMQRCEWGFAFKTPHCDKLNQF